MRKLILLVLILQSVVCFSQNTTDSFIQNWINYEIATGGLKVDKPKTTQVVTVPPVDNNYINLVNNLAAPQVRQPINTVINVTPVNYNIVQPVYSAPMWQGSSNLVVPMILAPATPMRITTINVIKY